MTRLRLSPLPWVLLLYGCTAYDTVAYGLCPPGELCSDSGAAPALPAFCQEGQSPPILMGDGSQAGLCTGELAERFFDRALCACSSISLNDTLFADSFDSRTAPYAPDSGTRGDLAVNDALSTTGMFDVRGSLTVAGALGLSARPGLTISGNLAVAGRLGEADAQVTVGGNAALGGVIELAALTVTGTLTASPEATINVSGALTTGSTVREPVSVMPPCPCQSTELLDIAGLITAHSQDNDNATLGIEATALADITADTSMELGCGRYFLSRIQGDGGNVTITVSGSAALFIGENITLGRSLVIDIRPTGQLDLFLAGYANIAGQVLLGDPTAPARLRVYADSAGSLSLSGNSVLAANLYAPRTDVVLAAGAEVYGSLHINRLITAGPIALHYDQGVSSAAASCAAP